MKCHVCKHDKATMKDHPLDAKICEGCHYFSGSFYGSWEDHRLGELYGLWSVLLERYSGCELVKRRDKLKELVEARKKTLESRRKANETKTLNRLGLV